MKKSSGESMYNSERRRERERKRGRERERRAMNTVSFSKLTIIYRTSIYKLDEPDRRDTAGEVGTNS